MAFTAQADIIFFKDGMKTICQQKAWEQDGEVKCEYRGWVLSYRKEDVERIVKTTPEKNSPAPKNNSSHRPRVVNAKMPVSKKPDTAGGLTFYDPRRPYKYWASKNSKHRSFKEAVEALAKQYGRTPQWVQAHMGNTNDLARIHQNLAHPDADKKVAAAKPEADQPPGIVFYNPRRPNPYWTGPNAKHKTFKAAIDALASQYKRSAQWVQANMGTSNDLGEIRRSLSSRLTAEAGD